jgi:hypothetical protein
MEPASMQKHHREEGEEIAGSQVGLPGRKEIGIERGDEREWRTNSTSSEGLRLSWNTNTRQLAAISIQVITGG